jgi:ubiquinone/menaquinone biosynthesis C-methylase UbiE
MTHRFDDVDKWVKRFDAPERAQWQKPAELVAALAVVPGSTVVDIGAGTGYFNQLWSQAVGANGTVIAMDVEPGLVAYMRDRAEREGTPNVVPVLGSYDNPRIPRASADLLVMVNLYHHIDHRIVYLRGLAPALRPGARLVVVDFRPGDLPVGPPAGKKIAPEQVDAEMKEAGFEKIGALELLPHQFVSIFRVADGAK